jgi:hypothetical protein
MKMTLALFSIALLFCSTSFGEEQAPPVKSNKVKYKESGRIDFESLLIEGEREKPEMSVVTGNIGEKDSGLLVFRKNFQDMMANDFGENIQ